jgi:transposase
VSRERRQRKGEPVMALERSRERDRKIHELAKRGVSHSGLCERFGLSYSAVTTALGRYRRRLETVKQHGRCAPPVNCVTK